MVLAILEHTLQSRLASTQLHLPPECWDHVACGTTARFLFFDHNLLNVLIVCLLVGFEKGFLSCTVSPGTSSIDQIRHKFRDPLPLNLGKPWNYARMM